MWSMAFINHLLYCLDFYGHSITTTTVMTTTVTTTTVTTTTVITCHSLADAQVIMVVFVVVVVVVFGGGFVVVFMGFHTGDLFYEALKHT